MTITFFISGDPKPQPRPRAFARRMGAKFVARVYDAGTAECWKSQIAMAARSFLPERPMEGPVDLSLTFYFRRPKSHYRTGKRSNELRPDAPAWHCQKPDRDNLEKAVADALTQLGFWQDDGQVCCGSVCKLWVGYVAEPGCFVEIKEVVKL